MAAIFQLFSAADLQKLAEHSSNWLDELRTRIRAERAPSPAVREKLRPRANEVFHQLVSSSSSSRSLPYSSTTPPPTPLADQLFSQQELAQLTTEQRNILELAIRCELDNSPYVLEVIMQQILGWLAELVQQGLVPPPPPPTPDAAYSPFSKEYKIVRAVDPPHNLTLVNWDWPW